MPQNETSNHHRTTPLSIRVDVAKYEAYLENADLSPDDREAFLQALWSIVCDFVALGFGVHPLQDAVADDPENSCGQFAESGAVGGDTPGDMLEFGEKLHADYVRQTIFQDEDRL
ncbi:MAG: hypothetical protein AAFR03_00395 [Pseudomonadota bacterium]